MYGEKNGDGSHTYILSEWLMSENNWKCTGNTFASFFFMLRFRVVFTPIDIILVIIIVTIIVINNDGLWIFSLCIYKDKNDCTLFHWSKDQIHFHIYAFSAKPFKSLHTFCTVWSRLMSIVDAWYCYVLDTFMLTN